MTVSNAGPLKTTSWGLLLIVIGISSYAYMVGMYNVDNSWLMIAAQRFLSGETLYVDIMETNPPLIIYLYSIPAFIADQLSLPPYTSLILCMQITMLFCTLWSLRYADHKTGWFIASIICLWLLVGRDFAQREHLFITLCWPLICALLHSKQPRSLTLLAAGIGTAIKPYFILLWMGIALAQAIQATSIRPLFARHNIALALIQIAYLCFIYLIHPDYITNIVSILAQGYHFYDRALLDFMQDFYVTILFGLAIAMLGIRVFQNGQNTALFIGAIGGLVASGMLQHKGYPYHFYPALSVLLIWLCWHIIYKPDDKNALQRTTMVIITGWIMLQSLTSFLWYYRLLSTNADTELRQLTEAVKKHASNEPVFVFSFDLVYPRIILKAGADLPYPFAQLWTLPHYILSEAQQPLSTPIPDETSHREQITETFLTRPPQAVLVSDRDYYWYQQDRHFSFDFIAYFSQDERFKHVWNQYEEVLHVNMNGTDEPPNYHRLYMRKDAP